MTAAEASPGQARSASAGRAAAGDAAGASLTNGAVRLRALAPHDLDWLRAAETDEHLAFRWRLRGAHPAPGDYADQLWNGVLALFVVEPVVPGMPLGIVSAYQADHRNGHCRVAAARLLPDESMDSSFLGGVSLFFDHLFHGWPFRKLYLETPEYNLPQFASAVDRGILRVEARLEEFQYLAGRHWDMLFLSVTRDSWEQFTTTAVGRRLLRRELDIARIAREHVNR